MVKLDLLDFVDHQDIMVLRVTLDLPDQSDLPDLQDIVVPRALQDHLDYLVFRAFVDHLGIMVLRAHLDLGPVPVFLRLYRALA